MNLELLGGIVLALLLLLNSLFSATQTALINARRQNLRELAERGNRKARLALSVAEDSNRVLTTFQLASLVTYFLIAALLSSLVLRLISMGLVPGLESIETAILFVVLMPLGALLTFILTSLLPDVLAHDNAEGWAMALAIPARLIITLMLPLVGLMEGLRHRIAALLGQPSDSAQVTEEEIMTLVDAGEEEGSIEAEEKEMIYSIFKLDETRAREIMVPRVDIVALEIGASLEEARELIIREGHSRIPVYEESLDHIKGLLYAKDLLTIWHEGRETFDIKSVLRAPIFVPESKRVSDLLRELRDAKVHLAIIVDEYGGTAGLVTIEDIVEEIVGEIVDEYDFDEEAPYLVIGEGEFIFDARIDLDDFNRIVETELSDELSDTLGGFIYAQLGRVPEAGEVVQVGNLCMEVAQVVDKRIYKVRVKKHLAEESPSESEHENDSALGKNGR